MQALLYILPPFHPSFPDIYFVSCIKLGAHAGVGINNLFKNDFQLNLTELFTALPIAVFSRENIILSLCTAVLVAFSVLLQVCV